ncbi:MAG: hypothetical protein H0W86_08340 [Armatimonadetes bacterium]|nr:hypothetical protein [Armatimonadota bacterium]
MRKLSIGFTAACGLAAVSLVGCSGTGGTLTVAEYEAKIKSGMEKARAMQVKVQTEGQEATKGTNPTDMAAMKAALPKMGAIMRKYKPEMDAITAEMVNLDPPVELKEFHALKAKDAEAEMKVMDKLIAAMEKGDMEGVQKATMDFTNTMMEAKKKSDEALKKAGYDPEKLDSEKKLVKLEPKK